MIRFEERMIDSWHLLYDPEAVIFSARSAFQRVDILQVPDLGRVLVLDGLTQTTEADEVMYHEMLVHAPMLAHGAARRVLIIGGGDGGTLREVLRHPVDRAVMVEIDPVVVEACKAHMPALSAGAFDDPRAELRIEDGIAFVAGTSERFDVILVDSTDPDGPGEVLFTDTFYRNAARCLAPGGVLVNQVGVPFTHPEGLQRATARMRSGFADVALMYGSVPTYGGGALAWGFASQSPTLRQVPVATLAERQAAVGLAMQHYTPELHVAAFALPVWLQNLLAAG